jgi:ABC-type multidrug transport system, ATPase component
MGYCPQHDAQWKNITVREHLECYAAIRGVPPSDINRYVNMNIVVYFYRVIEMNTLL